MCTVADHGLLREQVRVSDLALGYLRAVRELEGDSFDWLYLLEKPHKWQADFDLWRRHGMPSGPNAATWDAWAAEAAGA